MFVLFYFAVTLFTSATLLFLVQPMIGKMILPLLGGTPAVWNTCMVFFQGVLLAGYAYTHFVSTRLSRRSQLLLQAAVLVGPFFFLPFSLRDWTPPADSNPILSVLWILTIVVGVPFFVVSTTAPLLQKWFGFTGHPAAKDPYFLYGASNLGSMLALVLYPVLMEPIFAIPEQTVVWSVGYVVFAALVLGSIAMLLRTTPPVALAPAEPLVPQTTASPETAIAPKVRPSRLREKPIATPSESAATSTRPARHAGVTPLRRLRWIVLAAIPSSLMLGLTTYLTTDIAAIPFFWVVPLAIYLLTFILVFARWPVSWTSPRNKSDDTGTGILVGAVLALTLAAGISLHFLFEQFQSPFELGPSHILYFAFVLGLFGFVLTRGVDRSYVAAGIGTVALATGVAIHFVFYEYRSFYVLGPSNVLYLLTLVCLFVFWVTADIGSPHEFVLFFQPCFLLLLVLHVVSEQEQKPWVVFVLHVFSFAFITLLCHGELAKDRPSAEHLTDFYLCMSVGGVAGGLFNVFVAPFVFRYGLWEYPVVFIGACFLRPTMVESDPFIPGDSRKGEPNWLGRILDLAIPVAIGLAVYFLVRVDAGQGGLAFLHNWDPRWDGEPTTPPPRLRPFVMALPVVAALALALRPLRFGLSVALIWLIVGMFDDTGYRWVFRDRGFFGPVKVRIVDKDEARTGFEYKTLIHGGIDHGRQHIKESKRHEPCAYFHPLTGIGQVFMKLSWPNTPVPASLEEFFQKSNPYNVFTLPNQRFPAALAGVGNDPFSALVALHSEPPYAVIGLGTGTLAAFAKPYQSVDIYEIDPLVYRLSQKVDDEEPPFTYLEDAKKRGANLRVILGDGRLKIKDAPDNWYHIIVLDAFSSDAIPVHLLTVDAIETYLKKLAPGGVLVFNTTNRYVKLNGVLKDIADELDLECLKLGNWHTQVIPELYGTDFLAMRRNPRAIEKLNLSFSGGPPLSKRLDLERYNSLMKNIRLFQKEHRDFFRNENWSWQQWRAPKNFGGRLWTDRYSNLLSVLQIGEGKSPVVSDEGEVLSDD